MLFGLDDAFKAAQNYLSPAARATRQQQALLDDCRKLADQFRYGKNHFPSERSARFGHKDVVKVCQWAAAYDVSTPLAAICRHISTQANYSPAAVRFTLTELLQFAHHVGKIERAPKNFTQVSELVEVIAGNPNRETAWRDQLDAYKACVLRDVSLGAHILAAIVTMPMTDEERIARLPDMQKAFKRLEAEYLDENLIGFINPGFSDDLVVRYLPEINRLVNGHDNYELRDSDDQVHVSAAKIGDVWHVALPLHELDDSLRTGVLALSYTDDPFGWHLRPKNFGYEIHEAAATLEQLPVQPLLNVSDLTCLHTGSGNFVISYKIPKDKLPEGGLGAFIHNKYKNTGDADRLPEGQILEVANSSFERIRGVSQAQLDFLSRVAQYNRRWQEEAMGVAHHEPATVPSPTQPENKPI